MKAAVLLLLIALVIGFTRRGHLVVVNREIQRLEAGLDVTPRGASAGPVGRSRNLSVVETLSSELPPEMESKVRRFIGSQLWAMEKDAEWKALVKEFGRLDHRAVAELIRRLKKDEPVPSSASDGYRGYCSYCIDLLAWANPSEALRLLESMADLEDRDRAAADAFRRWGIDRPTDAIRWYDGLAGKGDTLADDPLLFERVLQVESRIDPAGALARVLSPELAFAPGAVAKLGATVAKDLRNEREHLAFLEALRRSEEQVPGSALLADLRGGYLKQLAALLQSWPFDEAVDLISAGFRPGEQEQVVERIGRCLDLAEPERWATWLAGVEVPANTRHPVTSLIYNWAGSDPESAGAWLDRMPPGELRGKAVESYVSSVSTEDPVLAVSRVLSLPEGPRRTGLLKLIHSSWRKKDPEAAAAFAGKHGL